jgi:hypothetical protein
VKVDVISIPCAPIVYPGDIVSDGVAKFVVVKFLELDGFDEIVTLRNPTSGEVFDDLGSDYFKVKDCNEC